VGGVLKAYLCDLKATGREQCACYPTLKPRQIHFLKLMGQTSSNHLLKCRCDRQCVLLLQVKCLK
jgi:hypothetical protein